MKERATFSKDIFENGKFFLKNLKVLTKKPQKRLGMTELRN